MKYKVTHTTKYEYSDTVPFCQNVVYLTPRKTPFQTISRHRLTVRPQPAVNHRRIDYFGNTSHVFSIDKGHKQLRITATSQVVGKVAQIHPLDGISNGGGGFIHPPDAFHRERAQRLFIVPDVFSVLTSHQSSPKKNLPYYPSGKVAMAKPHAIVPADHRHLPNASCPRVSPRDGPVTYLSAYGGAG